MTENELKRVIGLFGRNVFNTAYCYMKSYADAEDIRQETFIKLYTCGKSFESDEHIKAWLLRVTVNLCKNTLKSYRYRMVVPLDKAYDIEAEKACDDDFVSYLFRLKPKYRIALYMHYYEGFSVKEIASATGDKESTILSRLSRGRKQLKDILLKEGYNEFQ